MLVILFGRSGSGKNYVGRILETEFGFYFHDNDLGAPREVFERMSLQKRPPTEEMARASVDRFCRNLSALREEHPDLAGAMMMLYDWQAETCVANFPDAVFLLVDVPVELCLKRIAERKGHVADPDVARNTARTWMPPNVPCHRLTNAGGDEEIIRQLEVILSLNRHPSPESTPD